MVVGYFSDTEAIRVRISVSTLLFIIISDASSFAICASYVLFPDASTLQAMPIIPNIKIDTITILNKFKEKGYNTL